MGSKRFIWEHPASERCFQFIEFPSEWGVPWCSVNTRPSSRFQFIEFPSEWGELVKEPTWQRLMEVSNLLSSPASGERSSPAPGFFCFPQCFQFIEFPSEWGVLEGDGHPTLVQFPIY